MTRMMSENAYYLAELFGERAEATWNVLLTFALEQAKANYLEFAAPRWTIITGLRPQKRQWTISHEQFAFVWLSPAEAQAWQEADFAKGIRSFTRIENQNLPTKRP